MTNHYYIYLGRENGKRVIHKVGQTRQTCYARCKNADYKIGCAFDIIFSDKITDKEKRELLTVAENIVITRFREKYKIEHGREYFRTTKQNWNTVKAYFEEVTRDLLDGSVIVNNSIVGYTYHEGWVTANSY